MPKKKPGWYGESQRHALAAKGVRTGQKDRKKEAKKIIGDMEEVAEWEAMDDYFAGHDVEYDEFGEPIVHGDPDSFIITPTGDSSELADRTDLALVEDDHEVKRLNMEMGLDEWHFKTFLMKTDRGDAYEELYGMKSRVPRSDEPVYRIRMKPMQVMEAEEERKKLLTAWHNANVRTDPDKWYRDHEGMTDLERVGYRLENNAKRIEQVLMRDTGMSEKEARGYTTDFDYGDRKWFRKMGEGWI